MTRGESTREKTRFEILKFLYENEGPQLFKRIEANCSEARGTVKKYLDELKDEGLVEQSLRGRHPYRIAEKGRKYVKLELLRRDLYDLTRSFDAKWLELLRRLLDSLRKEGTDPKEFFNHHCLAFVGGIPWIFQKSMVGMENVLRREKEFTTRGAKEGLTKEEYVGKIARQIAKQRTPTRKMLASMGWSEKQIEAYMHIQEIIRKQGIARIYVSIREEEKLDERSLLEKRLGQF